MSGGPGELVPRITWTPMPMGGTQSEENQDRALLKKKNGAQIRGPLAFATNTLSARSSAGALPVSV